VNAGFFAASEKERFCCYATLNKDKLLLKISFSLYNFERFSPLSFKTSTKGSELNNY